MMSMDVVQLSDDVYSTHSRDTAETQREAQG
jgi:hypothetical protein